MKILITLLFLVFSFPRPGEAAKTLNVQRHVTPAGIEFWLAQDKNVPVISLSFSFRGGLLLDPKEKPGVARLVSIMLDEGAGAFDSQSFQKQLTDNAIALNFSARRDVFSGQIRTLKNKKETAFDLLHLALTEPHFDADSLTRMKNANLAQIKDSLGDPSWLVARTFNGMVFQDHPYAQPGFGNLSSINTITAQDLKDFTQRQFARNLLTVALAGDIDAKTAAADIDRIFASLPASAEEPDAPLLEIKHAGKVILLPHQVPQTFITVGQKGLHHTDKLWPAAVVLNYILGGGSFDSRLMEEIRVKRGLTYGVYSSLSSMAKGAVMMASLSTSNDTAKEALDVLKAEWDKISRTPPSDAEIEHAKAFLTGSTLLRLTSTASIASLLNDLQNDGFDHNYINRYAASINSVTAQDVKTVAGMLNPDTLTIVLVGMPKDIQADITLKEPPGMQ